MGAEFSGGFPGIYGKYRGENGRVLVDLGKEEAGNTVATVCSSLLFLRFSSDQNGCYFIEKVLK